MKKFLSMLLSAAMLTTALSATALAADHSSLPTLELNKSKSFTFQPTAEKDQDKGVAEATFTPSEDGWYSFVCDTRFSGKGPDDPETSKPTVGVCTAAITWEDGEEYSVCGMAWCFDFASIDTSSLTEEQRQAWEEITESSSTQISFTANLEKGKTYYYRFSNESTTAFTTNLTVSTHKHTFDGKSEMRKGEISDGCRSSGGVFRSCTTMNCYGEEVVEYFPMVEECDLAKEQYVYTGKDIKPAVTVKTEGGKKLDSKYYTVSYNNNKKAGKATVAIKFKDHYEGTLKLTFKIVPAGTKLTKARAKKKAIALSWKKQAKETCGYQIQYATKKNFSGAKTVTVKGNKTTSRTIKSLKSKKTYYIRIRTYKTVNGKNYCSAWSAKKSVKTK